MARLAERFGISPGRVSMIAPLRRTEPSAWKCHRPPCVEPRPHEHCAACGLIVRPDRRLCELCEREAHRALLVATGGRDLADRLRTTERDELLGRILNALGRDREMWEVA